MGKEFPTEVVLSITTGVLLCEFGAMHECCEFLCGGPVWTHQFAHRPFIEKLRSAVWMQHPQIAVGVNAKGVGPDNWEHFRDAMIADFGKTLSLVPASEVKGFEISAEDRHQSFAEPLSGKEVIGVTVA